jgi:hypothetical protein
MESKEFLAQYAVWDSWYTRSPSGAAVFMLCAERRFFGDGTHHEHALLASATCSDMAKLADHKAWEDYSLLHQLNEPLDKSIWTGSAIYWQEQYILAYTVRSNLGAYFAGQAIHFAISDDLKRWTKVVEHLSIGSLDPDQQWFTHFPTDDDRTVHAWRDPYLFTWENKLYAVVAVKDRPSPKSGVKRNINRRASLALLSAAVEMGNPAKFTWVLERPHLISPNIYEELEVPQVFKQPDGAIWLVASTWEDADYELSWIEGNRPTAAGQGSGIQYRNRGYLLAFKAESISDFLCGKLCSEDPIVLINPRHRLFAGRVIPESNAAVLGFEPSIGEPRAVQTEGLVKQLRHLTS